MKEADFTCPSPAKAPQQDRDQGQKNNKSVKISSDSNDKRSTSPLKSALWPPAVGFEPGIRPSKEKFKYGAPEVKRSPCEEGGTKL